MKNVKLSYPEETLVNASCIREEDDIFYSASTNYFTALPEGARILVQRDSSRAPLRRFPDGDTLCKRGFLRELISI